MCYYDARPLLLLHSSWHAEMPPNRERSAEEADRRSASVVPLDDLDDLADGKAKFAVGPDSALGTTVETDSMPTCNTVRIL